MTSVLSILHRITGVILAIGVVLIAVWFWSLILGEQQFNMLDSLLESTIGRVFLFIWVVCTCYHLLNGIRHLLWDMLIGFELNQVYFSGKLVLFGSILLATLLWFL